MATHHVHILGICGTFMGGIAAIAKQLGHKVTGSDQHVYPPMSDQLESLGIELTQGWDATQFSPEPDIVIIGNALSRGNPAVEYVLDRNINYTSGAQWLAEHCLQDRWVLAVAGTHGKTTTTSMLAWILENNGMAPGYLIGGVCHHFPQSARIGDAPFFVIEADEYDTAFFDKRSKFVHYRPKTLVINNLEFDHADIFTDLDAIKRQFHHVVRTVPGIGRVLFNGDDENVKDMLELGCWSEQQSMGIGSENDWQAINNSDDASSFTVRFKGEEKGVVSWGLLGQHNMMNGLAALVAATHAGIKVEDAIVSLNRFEGVKRRLEVKGKPNNITVYDDFAHHPTAISSTLTGLRKNVGKKRIIAVLEPRSNTMKMGVHQATLADSLEKADISFIYMPEQQTWKLQSENQNIVTYGIVEDMIKAIVEFAEPSDHIVVMSNGSFGGLHGKLIELLAK